MKSRSFNFLFIDTDVRQIKGSANIKRIVMCCPTMFPALIPRVSETPSDKWKTMLPTHISSFDVLTVEGSAYITSSRSVDRESQNMWFIQQLFDPHVACGWALRKRNVHSDDICINLWWPFRLRQQTDQSLPKPSGFSHCKAPSTFKAICVLLCSWWLVGIPPSCYTGNPLMHLPPPHTCSNHIIRLLVLGWTPFLLVTATAIWVQWTYCHVQETHLRGAFNIVPFCLLGQITTAVDSRSFIL